MLNSLSYKSVLTYIIRQIVTFTTIISLLVSLFTATPSHGAPVEEIPNNLLSIADSTFESDTVIENVGWKTAGTGGLAVTANGRNGGSCLTMQNRTNDWTSPAYNIYEPIRASGAGHYKIALWFRLDGTKSKVNKINSFGALIRGRDGGGDENSFILRTENSAQCIDRLDYSTGAFKAGEWYYAEKILYVSNGDLDGKDHLWNFCLDSLGTAVKDLSIDDVSLTKLTGPLGSDSESIPTKATQWIATEIALKSTQSYTDCFNDVDADIILTNQSTGRVLNVPGFWDGGAVWKFRFALVETGEWSYRTVCTNAEDMGLNNRQGFITCDKYTGNLDLYKHGFVKSTSGTRYFTYDDGTPFLYLGDTHWNYPSEEFDSAGPHAGDLKTDSHFKYIVDKRVEQGFTVYQSEPIGAKYYLADGLTQKDIYGFQDLDRRFEYIAQKGLVHSNAELFFVDELANHLNNYSDKYLEKLARYWAARYSAYPVLWSTAQECDDDFFYDAGLQTAFDANTNPWKKMLAMTVKYDPYKHPGSAHQEFASMSDTKGTNATRSSFKNVPGHTWFAVQWSPALNKQFDFAIAKNYWFEGQGKPVVNYEGRYENLWTKNFGARAQGWISFLSGMCGYGYGAIDTWLYNSTYNINEESDDSKDKITIADKQVPWSESVNFDTAKQLGYMRGFLEENDWYKLTPRFDDSKWSSFSKFYISYFALASISNEKYIAYFYNSTKYVVGTVNGMENCNYTLQWYNPRDNTDTTPKTVHPLNGKYYISTKPDGLDWVMILTKA